MCEYLSNKIKCSVAQFLHPLLTDFQNQALSDKGVCYSLIILSLKTSAQLIKEAECSLAYTVCIELEFF